MNVLDHHHIAEQGKGAPRPNFVDDFQKYALRPLAAQQRHGPATTARGEAQLP